MPPFPVQAANATTCLYALENTTPYIRRHVRRVLCPSFSLGDTDNIAIRIQAEVGSCLLIASPYSLSRLEFLLKDRAQATLYACLRLGIPSSEDRRDSGCVDSLLL